MTHLRLNIELADSSLLFPARLERQAQSISGVCSLTGSGGYNCKRGNLVE